MGAGLANRNSLTGFRETVSSESDNHMPAPSDPIKSPARPSSGVPPLFGSGEPASGQRVTVQSIEQEVRGRRRDYDYSTARSRRHRQREESGPARWLWLAVAGVALLYLGWLALAVVKPGVVPVPKPTAPPPPPAPIADEMAPAETVPGPDAAESSAVSAQRLIANWKLVELRTEEGRRYSRNRQWALAESKFNEALEVAPRHVPALLELAAAQREQKRPADMRDTLVRVMAIDGSSASSRIQLAQAYAQLGEYENALAMAQWTLEGEPYSLDALQVTADALTALGRDEQAVAVWQKLAALNSANLSARNHLGAAQLRLGQWSPAIATFESIIRADPANPQAHYNLAIAFVKKNEPELAVDVLRQASARLGGSFVLAWTRGPDFDPIRAHASFQEYFGDAATASPTGAPGPESAPSPAP